MAEATIVVKLVDEIVVSIVAVLCCFVLILKLMEKVCQFNDRFKRNYYN